MEEILIKHILNEASEEEQALVRSWLAEDSTHRQRYEQLLLIWRESKKLESQSKVDTNDAWKRLQSRIQANQNATASVKTYRLKRIMVWRAAASVLLLIGLGIGAYYFSISRKITIVSDNVVVTDTLPDHSVITLNKNSSISYRRSFNKRNREVVLNGEAFFNVVHNEDIPFKVAVNNIEISDVGTSFNIRSDKGNTEIIVTSGEVLIKYKGRTARVLPDQKINISKGSAMLRVEANNDELYQYYRTRQFVCYNTPLYRLVEALNNSYNAQIKIQGAKVAQLKITAEFDNEPLDNILRVVVTTLGLQIVKQENGEIILQ